MLLLKVVFFPSYRYMEEVVSSWASGQLLEQVRTCRPRRPGGEGPQRRLAERGGWRREEARRLAEREGWRREKAGGS